MRAAGQPRRGRPPHGRGIQDHRIAGVPDDEERVADVGRRSFDRASDPAGVMRQLGAIGASGDRTAALRQLTVPALVIHGADDPLVTVAGGEATAAALPAPD